MKSLLRRIRRARIKEQLSIIYFIVIFLPITIIGSFLIINTARLLTSYHRDLLKSDNLRVKTILFEITTQIYNISEELAFDEEIRKVLSGNGGLRSDLVKRASEVTIADSYEYNYPEIEAIEIYTDNPAFMDDKQFYRADREIQESEWFRKATGQSSVFWVPMVSYDRHGNEYWNFCLVRKIPMVNSSANAVLVIRISDNYLKTRIGSQEYISMLSVDEGPVFFSSSRQAYGTPQAVEIDREEEYYQYSGNVRLNGSMGLVEVSTLNMYQSDSRVYICTVNDQAYGNIRNIILICLVIIGVAILLPALVIHVFTGYFTARILTLRQAMHQASNEDYEFESSLQGQDEVSEAFSDLEVMVHNIKQKDADMYEARLNEQKLLSEQRAMEFKMLSSQINPHFLYNTLETIRMKAFTAGNREVANTIKLLGKSMRYVLENTGTAFSTLGRELEHVEVYLAIQKVRFGDKFDSVTEIGEGINVEKIRILPLLLQPVVENAILHGLEETETGGMIRIVLCRETEGQKPDTQKKAPGKSGKENIRITVIDNGCGMGESELAELRVRIEEREEGRTRSIGLYNINQRLKLSYGEEYGVEISSAVGEGTRVEMRIPSDADIPSAKG